MQTPLVLFFTLVLLSTSVITTPIPGYVPGDIVKARPKHWEDRNKTAGKHFGVVVGQNPTNDKYKVAHTSHSLPEDKYPQQEDAAKYHEKFGDAKINTGRPVEVAKEHLYPAGNQDGWHKMEDEKLVALKTQINKNCPDSRLRKRGLRDALQGLIRMHTMVNRTYCMGRQEAVSGVGPHSVHEQLLYNSTLVNLATQSFLEV